MRPRQKRPAQRRDPAKSADVKTSMMSGGGGGSKRSPAPSRQFPSGLPSFLTAVLDALPVGLYIVDQDLRVVAWNSSRERGPLGIPRNEALGRRLEELLPPEGLRTTLPLIREVFKTGTLREETTKTHQGRIFQVRRLPIGSGEEITHVLSWFEDITERHQAEEALRLRERQHAALAALGERALTGLDLALLMNEAVGLISGTLGVEYCEVLELLPDGRALVLRAGVGWQEGLIGRATVGVEKDSQAGYTLFSMGPVVVADHRTETRFKGPPLLRDHGVVSGMSVTILGRDRPFGVLGAHTEARRDFTEDEVHFISSVAHILGTAIDRNRLEERLRQAQKMEAVGQLAGGVAHDFNNLLGVIMGRAEFLSRHLGPEDPSRRHLDQLRRAADHAAGLTRQLLAFSRKQVLQPRVLDLNAVVAEVEGMLSRLIGEDIQLVSVLGADLGRVKTDPAQLEQVIMNLALNARDAMPAGGKLIIETGNADLDATHVRVHPDAQPGPHVLLAVSDTGQGMDAETLPRIFEPFFTTKEQGKGTGLGLATVYGIVKQSGGHVAVFSEPGRGSTFKIYLPRINEAEEARLATAAPARPPPRGSETILLVEDEGALREVIRETLEGAGYRVLAATGGFAALELAERHGDPIHILLTDVVMPGMNGHELAERLAERRHETKVLYMSGYTDEIIGHQGAIGPGIQLIEKPFVAETLLSKVRAILDAPQ